TLLAPPAGRGAAPHRARPDAGRRRHHPGPARCGEGIEARARLLQGPGRPLPVVRRCGAALPVAALRRQGGVLGGPRGDDHRRPGDADAGRERHRQDAEPSRRSLRLAGLRRPAHRVGPAKVVESARRMGNPGPAWLPGRSGCKQTASDHCPTQLEALPSIALGSEEVTPLEMASAYATLAAGGTYRQPKLVSKVTDGAGQILESGPSAPVQAISPQVAYTATSLLQEVITQGTGTAA